MTKFFPYWISADSLLTYTVYPTGETGRLGDPVYKIKKGRATHFSTLNISTVSLLLSYITSTVGTNFASDGHELIW